MATTGTAADVDVTDASGPDDAHSLRRFAAQIVRIGGWSIDVPSRAVHWSDELYELLEWSRGTPPDLPRCLAFFDDAPRLASAIDACATEGTPFDLEMSLRTVSERSMWARLVGEPERDAEGTVVRIVGAFQDVTDHRAAARQAIELAARLTASLDAVTDACYLLDADWRFTFLNARAEELVQRRRDDLLGRVVWDEFPDALDTDVEDAYRRAVQLQQVERIPTYPFPSLDTTFEIVVYPWGGGLAVFFRDIGDTLARQAELERQAEREHQTAARLRQLDRAKNTFLSAVSHELRNPLTVVQGLAQTLQRWRGSLDDERRARLEDAIVDNADRLDRLLGDLLDLDRLTRDDLGAVRVRGDVVPVIREAVRGADRDRRVTVAAPDRLVAEVDQVQLERIVDNLVRNAAKYASGAEATVTVTPFGQAGLAVDVTDHGPGIPDEERRWVFAPFHRLTTDRARPGTGIGLSLVAAFADLHGGCARALPSDTGAHLRVELPGPSDTG